MRGQLTIEYLFLLLVSLALVALSLGALLKVRDAGERTYRLELFKSSALDIYNSGEELCSMGSGNSMGLRIRENVSISPNGDETIFSNSDLNVSVSKTTLCPYSSAAVGANSEIEIRNEDGGIKITELQP